MTMPQSLTRTYRIRWPIASLLGAAAGVLLSYVILPHRFGQDTVEAYGGTYGFFALAAVTPGLLIVLAIFLARIGYMAVNAVLVPGLAAWTIVFGLRAASTPSAGANLWAAVMIIYNIPISTLSAGLAFIVDALIYQRQRQDSTTSQPP
jgi:hypothetical protein